MNKRKDDTTIDVEWLTDMPTEISIDQIITKTIPQGGTFFLIDFDDMNKIKEMFGETFGNRILKDFTEDLKLICRDSDLLGRVGEKEFFVFMPQVLEKTGINSIAERFRQSIQSIIIKNEIGNAVKKGAGIAAITTEERKFQSFEDVLFCLQDTLQQATDEAVLVEADANSIFSHVFSMQVQSALSVDELTATMQAMNNTNNANFFIRLSDQSYVVLKNRNVGKIHNEIVCENAQKMLDSEIKKKVIPEFQEDFFSFVNLNTLAKRMTNEESIKFEYQNVLREWCLATFSVIQRVNGIVTKVIFLISNLTHDRAEAQVLLQRQKEAVSMLSNSELLFISTIHKKTGASRVLQARHIINANKIFDFDKSMEKEAAHMLPSDRQYFLEKVCLNNLKKELEYQDQFSVTTVLRLPDSGHYRRVSYHFSNCKDSPEYILSATEDVTEPFTRDAITGMKNYEGFKLDCMYEMSQGAPDQYIVINFNIVNFKAINTLYGYESGNWLLKTVFQKLSESPVHFRSICRENADNFFCLCRKEDYDLESLNRLCKMTVSDKTGLTDSVELFCGIYSISENTESFDNICDKARLARRRAEQEIGVNTYVLGEKEKEQYLDDAAILNSVPRAIKNEELVVYYQPIYDAKSKEIVSAEALVRWQHPEKGLIFPGAFIPVVERTGQIVQIDLYVGQHVRQFQSERLAVGKRLIPISINVSRYDFLREKYMNSVLESMKDHQEIANMIRIEITESGLINIPSSGEYFMHEMRSLGIQTMIDDFGTGYSSLTSIIERPCDIIKLDMSFARQIGIKKKMEILVVSAIDTAHRLGVKVVAEGVETEEQYEFLKNSGCDYIQGFYFSKPLPQEEFERLLGKSGK